jgi:hypothetical protein
MSLFLPKLDKTMPLVTGKITINGKPVEFEAIATPQFQRFWQTQSVKIDSAAAGGSFVTETAALTYDPAQMQRVIDALAALYQGLS